MLLTSQNAELFYLTKITAESYCTNSYQTSNLILIRRHKWILEPEFSD